MRLALERCGITIACIGLGLLLVSCSRNQKAKEERAHGTIKEIDPVERRLVIKEKETGADSNAVVKVRRTYRVTFDAHISTAEKRKADFSDLKVADRINYRFTKSGEEFIIHKITPRGTESGNNKTESTH